MPWFLAAAVCCAVLVQGGFFPAFFLFAGAVLALALALTGREVRVPSPLWPLAGLSLWALLAGVVNGGSWRSLAQGALPLVCLVFGVLICSLTGEERRETLIWVSRFGGVAAILALLAFLGILPIPGAMTAHRLQFTFQYVNAAAVWFGTVLSLQWELGDRWSRYLSPFVALALLLTRSVGGIGLFLILQGITLLGRERRTWRTWTALGVGCALGAAAVATRWRQALGTLEERLVQTGDGLRAMMASPVFGFGPGRWGEVKDLFQSYEYRAQVVHNSYVHTGVETGVMGLLLLAAAVLLALWALRGKPLDLWTAALLIPLHGLVDFSLLFFSVDALLMAVLALGTPAGEGRPLPKFMTRAVGGLLCLFFILLMVFSRQ